MLCACSERRRSGRIVDETYGQQTDKRKENGAREKTGNTSSETGKGKASDGAPEIVPRFRSDADIKVSDEFPFREATFDQKHVTLHSCLYTIYVFYK